LAGVLLALCLCGLNAQAQRVIFEGIPDLGHAYSRTWVDVNNDGKDDYCALVGGNAQVLLCYLSTGNGFQPTPSTFTIGNYPVGSQVRWTDINGDGQIDICRTMFYPGVFYDQAATVVTSEIKCHLGPTFTSAVSVQVPVSVYTQCVPGDGCAGPRTEGLFEPKDVYFVDVDLDGRADLCYVHVLADWTSFSVRCMLNTGSGFASPTSAWIRPLSPVGDVTRPRGFYDVNGDGYPDFCRTEGGIFCVLGSATGFASTGTMDVSTPAFSKDGAAFVDINGDGKTDLCRVNESPHFLACRLSTGMTWEATDRTSVGFTSSSNTTSRWWVDINGDGLPDYCRAVGPDPNTGSNMSNLWCRLARGGDATTGLFAPQDIMLDGNTAVGAVHFGLSSGGRMFCDPFGAGIQTLCFATYREVVLGPEQCYEGVSQTVCYTPTANSNGIGVGVYGGLNVTSPSADQIQARLPLLSSYSDGLGAETRVTYMPLSSEQVYAKSGPGSTFPRVQIVQPRAPVVFETRAWRTGADVTLTGNARYFYKDLRVDSQTGSRGFRERWFLTEGANTLEHTIYYQGLGATVDASSIDASAADPAVAAKGLLEIGQAKEKRVYAIDPLRIPDSVPEWSPPSGANPRQKKLATTMHQATTLTGAMSTTAVSPPTVDNPFMLLKRTTTTLGETVPPSPRFRPVVATHTEAWDWNDRTAVALPVIDGSSVTSNAGNVTSLVETTTQDSQVWSKTTTNTYADDTTNWFLGRLTRATVTSAAPTVATQLAANATSYGTAPNANTTSSAAATVVTLSSPVISNTQVGQTSTATATVTNTAPNPLVIVPPTAGSVTGPDLSFVSTTCGSQLAASATCTITVRFAPTSASTVSGSVSVDTASGPRVAAFNATSLANFSTATLTSAAPNLGSVWYGASPAPTATATFRNDGNTAMTLTGLSGLSTRFQLSGNTCAAIAPGVSCSMTLTMPTSAAGSTPSAVTTAGATNDASFSISGTVNSSISRWSVTTLAFGNVTTGQTKVLSLTLYNDGFGLAAAWNTALANLPAGFTANTSACASVSPGASCSVSITFAPTAAQAYSGSSIRPATVSSTGNTLAVSGTGVLPTTTLSSNPASSLSFGGVPKDSYKTLPLTLTNTGTVAATGMAYAIAYTGGSIAMGDYSVSIGTCPAAGGSLAAGATCSMSVRYSTGCTAGSRPGTLTISGSNLSASRTLSMTASTNNGVCY
jgi:hypothetical protein